MATPEPVKSVIPLGNKVGHLRLANELVSCFVVGILSGQRLVGGKPALRALLLFAGHQFEGQKPFAASPSTHADPRWWAIDPRHS
jgi:hypothetical protein